MGLSRVIRPAARSLPKWRSLIGIHAPEGVNVGPLAYIPLLGLFFVFGTATFGVSNAHTSKGTTTMNRFTKIASTTVLAFALISNAAQAATATTSFAVSAVVASGCAVTALPLAFGAYDAAGSSQLDATTSVTVLCTLGTAYNVGLNAGTGSGATVATRKLTNGANTLNYTLYGDSNHTTVWGNTVGTNTVSGTYTLAQPAYTVYGRIASGQVVPAGTYTDTITVTITY